MICSYLQHSQGLEIASNRPKLVARLVAHKSAGSALVRVTEGPSQPRCCEQRRREQRRFANLTNPVLAHRCSRLLLELRAPSCSGMAPFAILWPVFGQRHITYL